MGRARPRRGVPAVAAVGLLGTVLLGLAGCGSAAASAP